MAKAITDPLSGSKIPVDGGQNSTITILLQILVELRVHSQYLQALASGMPLTDPPNFLRADEIIDTSFIN